MSKKCINCNNPKKYSDTTVRCEKCNNFLRKIDHTNIPGQNEQINFNNVNDEGSYSGYNYFQNDLNKEAETHNRNHNKENNQEYDSNKVNREGWKSKVLKFKFPIRRKLEPISQGVVRNFSEKEVKTLMITKVYRCLTQWVNYTPSNFINSFQVYRGWGVNNGERERGQDIVFYGKVSKGNIVNNNEIIIYGKKLKSGTVVARKVYNKTTDAYVKINYAISPFIIIAILAYIASLIYKLVSYDWDLFLFKVKFSIFMILICIIIFYFFIIRPIISIFKK